MVSILYTNGCLQIICLEPFDGSGVPTRDVPMMFFDFQKKTLFAKLNFQNQDCSENVIFYFFYFFYIFFICGIVSTLKTGGASNGCVYLLLLLVAPSGQSERTIYKFSSPSFISGQIVAPSGSIPPLLDREWETKESIACLWLYVQCAYLRMYVFRPFCLIWLCNIFNL